MTSEERTHPTVMVRWCDREGLIDVKIAPLVLEMWKAGLTTTNSCEDNVPRGYIWVEFLTVWDAERFLDIVGRYDEPLTPESQYARTLHSDNPNGWLYAINLDDRAIAHEFDEDGELLEDEEGFPVEIRMEETPRFRFLVSVRFPQSDLRWVTERLRAWNDGRGA